jgi:hypothetical protein
LNCSPADANEPLDAEPERPVLEVRLTVISASHASSLVPIRERTLLEEPPPPPPTLSLRVLLQGRDRFG